jgi:hypothetical protein
MGASERLQRYMILSAKKNTPKFTPPDTNLDAKIKKLGKEERDIYDQIIRAAKDLDKAAKMIKKNNMNPTFAGSLQDISSSISSKARSFLELKKD